MMRKDTELLAEYANGRSEAAFAELVRRHIDLVYSAALRLLAGDAHQAQDVAQQVFAELARQARPLSTHPALVGWLYTTTRRMSLRATRTEQRRQIREEEAHAMTESLRENGPAENWDELHPVLEDAMHSLAETDRVAVLLRYFQNKPLKEVGAELGLKENAARMRVDRALDKLRLILTQRGVVLTAAGLASILAANAIQAAPAKIAGAIAAGSIAGVAATGTNSLASFSAFKAGLAGAAAVAVLVTAPLAVQHRSIDSLRLENESLRQDKDRLAMLASTTNDSKAQPESTSKQSSDDQLRELLRLRAEVTRLRRLAQESGKDATAKSSQADPMAAQIEAWLARISDLKQKLDAHPEWKIPELQFLTARDWMNVALDARPDTESGARAAFSRLRALAKQEFAPALRRALNACVTANNGALPENISQLKSYFESPVDTAILDRYQISRTGKAADVTADNPTVISEKARVDNDYDTLLAIGLNGNLILSEGGNGQFSSAAVFSEDFGTPQPHAGGGAGSFGSFRVMQIGTTNTTNN